MEAVCVVPAHYPIVEKDFLEPHDLQDLPYISLGQNSPLRLKIDQVFMEAQVTRHELMETSLAASAIALVASGPWCLHRGFFHGDISQPEQCRASTFPAKYSL